MGEPGWRLQLAPHLASNVLQIYMKKEERAFVHAPTFCRNFPRNFHSIMPFKTHKTLQQGYDVIIPIFTDETRD